MPLTKEQRRNINLGIETAIILVLVTVYFEPEVEIFLDPIRLFFNIILLFILSGFIVPLVYTRKSSELQSILGVLTIFYIHAIILYSASIIFLAIPIEEFLSPIYLTVVLLSAPITTIIWLGIFSIFTNLRSKSNVTEIESTDDVENTLE